MPRALFIGRFQPFHNAHLLDVKNILKECNEIIIGIGSSNEKNTLENPFSYNERKQMISAALGKEKIKNYKICPVPDLHNDEKWIAHIEKNLLRHASERERTRSHVTVDFFYSGNQWILKCFRKHNHNVKRIKIVKGISSTKIRQMMINGKNWEKFVPRQIAEYIKKINGVERVRKIYANK